MSNIYDFVIQRGILKKYTGSDKDVVIPDEVRAIDQKVFFFMPGIKHITIPERVKFIDGYAFCKCTGLENVVIPPNVTTIEEGAFSHCTDLTGVVLPEGVTVIGPVAFEYCRKLESITIPESVTEIGEKAFFGCAGLTSLRIPPNVGVLGKGAFDNCQGLTEVTIEAEKVRGVKQAFSDSEKILFLTKKITLLSEVQRLNAVELFAEKGGKIAEPYRSVYCKHIKSKAENYIKSAMQHRELLELMLREKLIPQQMTQAYLEEADSSGNAWAVERMREYIASLDASEKKPAKKQKKAEKAEPGQKKPAQKPEGIAGLTFVITGKLETFENRAALKEYLVSRGAVLAASMTAKVDYLIMNDSDSDTEKKKTAEKLEIKTITEQQFNAMAHREFDISADHVLVKYAGVNADVVIPEGVRAIGEKAFFKCQQLRSVVIPQSVTTIGLHAFSWCSNLERVEIPEGVTTIDGYAFYQCRSLKTLELPQSLTTIGFGAFENCTELENVEIPEGVTTIDDRAFCYCEKITHITVPAGVARLDDGQFCGCTALRSVELREGLTLIGETVFSECTSLESIVIPEGVTTIGNRAFYVLRRSENSTALKRVTLPESIRSIHKDAFGQNADILFLTPKLSVLTPEQQRKSAIAFAENGGDCAEAYRDVYIRHIKQKASDYLEDAVLHPRLLELMHRENLIPAKDAQAYLEAVQKTGNTESIALMMDYIANHLTTSEKEKAEKEKAAIEDAMFEKKLQRAGKTGIDGLTFVTTTHLMTYETRADIKAIIESRGAKLASAVSPKVDYLVTNGHPDDSQKKSQAEALGIEIITERQFNDLAGRSFLIAPNRTLQRYVGTGGDAVVPDYVTGIAKNAFAGCRELTSLVIGDRVKSIGESAFANCSSLKKIVLPGKLGRISPCMLSSCINLEQITIPASVTGIGSYAFSDCQKLTEVVIPEGVTRIDDSAFSGCTGLTRIVIPGSVMFIHPDVFTKRYGYQPPLILKPTIFAPAGSYAEVFAEKRGIPFVAV